LTQAFGFILQIFVIRVEQQHFAATKICRYKTQRNVTSLTGWHSLTAF